MKFDFDIQTMSNKPQSWPLIASFALLCTLLPLSSSVYAEDASNDAEQAAGSGLINRAPFVSTKLKPSNLDRISTDIINITESIDNILTNSDIEDTDPETEIIADKVEEQPEPQPQLAEPEQPTEAPVAKPVQDVDLAQPVKLIEKKAEPVIATSKQPEAEKPALKPVAVSKLPSEPGNTPGNFKETNKVRYLKLDAQGNKLPDDAKQWACVKDEVNNLIWEVKSSDGSLRDKNNLYTWFQPASSEPLAGVRDGGQCDGDTDCDTYAYVQAMNASNFCGYSDWRLPTQQEMLSIVNFENPKVPATINSDYFPQTLASWYWTASSNDAHPEHAWYVLFRNGIALNDLKEHPKHVRLVRSQTEKG